jgi:hypothetical protein
LRSIRRSRSTLHHEATTADENLETREEVPGLVAVYAIATLLGVIGIIGWVVLGMVATAVPGKEALDPDTRFGVTGRDVVAGLTGIGLGGMSASYGGAGTFLGLLGALAGGAAAVVVGRYLGVEEDSDGDVA